jgi:glyoxylase-like metal-dependent hydrolase (beta-lactamase superfamily II)
MLVDVGSFESEIADFLDANGLRLIKVFITHDHFDHSGGVSEIVDEYGAEVLSAAGRTGGAKATRVAHGDEVRVGKLVGRVVATPGHTPDSISLIFPGMAFTGDALFAGSVGGTSSAAAAGEQVDAIRAHLFSLPPETELHTGHGPSSTVKVESEHNPFFV